MLQHSIQLHSIDTFWLVTYFLFVLGIRLRLLRRTVSGSKDFFESGRSLPALDLRSWLHRGEPGARRGHGMAASGAKYGMMTSHFYWIGAVPAMVFVAIFMMPFYYGSQGALGSRVPEAAYSTKDSRIQRPPSPGMTIMSSGSPCMRWPSCSTPSWAGTSTLHSRLGRHRPGLHLHGGLTSAIYNEVLQFFLIVFGFLPLVLLGLKDVGGLGRLGCQTGSSQPSTRDSPPTPGPIRGPTTGSAATNPMGVEWFGLAMGWDSCSPSAIGALTFSWCNGRWPPRTWGCPTNTNTRGGAQDVLPRAGDPTRPHRQSPLHSAGGNFHLRTKNGGLDYDMVVPTMLAHYFPTGMLGSA